MSLVVFAVVLFAAALHATWNAIVKGAGDKLLTMILVTSAAGTVAALVLPFLTLPAPASWPYLGVSLSLEVLYFALVAGAYRAADMSETYPVMRGTAPVLVAGVGTLWLGESLSLRGWAGVLLICGGILSQAWAAQRAGARKGIALALTNAAVIASYTLVDGAGVRISGAPASYILWLFLLTAMPLLGWALATRRTAFLRYASANWHLGLAGGIGAMTSYGLALWAMTGAPVALVAALRETSIVFAMLIAALGLQERMSKPRLLAAGLITFGAVALRLA